MLVNILKTYYSAFFKYDLISKVLIGLIFTSLPCRSTFTATIGVYSLILTESVVVNHSCFNTVYIFSRITFATFSE